MKKKLNELRTTNQLYDQKKTYEKNKAEMEAERKAKEDAEKAERDAKKAEKAAKKEAKKAEKDDAYEKVTVDKMGTDYSQYSSFKKGRDTVVDADFEDVSYDNPQTASSAAYGRQYITALLEEKN
jgi:membrane protein involved in colicin uptake